MLDYPEQYYQFLRLVTKLMNPSLVVELGTRQGYGAMAFVEGGATRVVTIDIDHSRIDPRCTHPAIDYRLGDSLVVDLSLRDIDILFIDTDHGGVHFGDRAMEEYQAWEPLVRVGGVILFDDVNINRSMQERWVSFSPQRGEKLTLDCHVGCGMGAVLI